MLEAAAQAGLLPWVHLPLIRPRRGESVGGSMSGLQCVGQQNARANNGTKTGNCQNNLGKPHLSEQRSEHDLQSKLDLPRRIRLRTDYSETGVGDASIWPAELDAVERVQELGPKLHSYVFMGKEFLE